MTRSPRRRRLSFWTALLCLLMATDTNAEPCPESLPVTLLSSPINATWAANHTGYWTDRGVGGFLLGGIQDRLDRDIWSVDGDPATTGGNDALLIEVRLANERLLQAGIDRNFVTVPFLPEKAYFADATAASGAIGCLESVGTFCRLAGLRGMALDTRPAVLLWDYRWDGYSYDGYGAAALAESARAFGESAIRAFLRTCPDGEILIITFGSASWNSLWTAFLEGALDAVHASKNAALHLLTAESCSETDPERLVLVAERTRRSVEDRLSTQARATWRKQGRIALGICASRQATPPQAIAQQPALNVGTSATPGPFETASVVQFVSSLFGFDEWASERSGEQAKRPDMPLAAGEANDPLRVLRVQMAMAKLLSDSYVWVDDPDASWWRVTDQDAQTYGSLLQNGSLVRLQTGAPAQALDEYSSRLPFDGLRRIGPYEAKQGPCYVLANADGVGLFFWQGLQDSLDVSGVGNVRVVDISDEQPCDTVVRDGKRVIDPEPSPTFVHPLPIGQWAAPASLWMDMPVCPTPSSAATWVDFGIVNRLGFTLEGSLDAITPEGISIKPLTTAFSLDPGSNLTVKGVLRGSFKVGAVISPSLVATSPGGTPVRRAFSFVVMPDIAWRHWFDGQVTGVSWGQTESGPSIVACTDAGEIACLSGEGSLRWKQRIPTSLQGRPGVAVDQDGGLRVATADTNGMVRVLGSKGAILWQKGFRDLVQWSLADLDNMPGAETLLVLTPGNLSALDEDGDERWAIAADESNRYTSLVTARTADSTKILLASAHLLVTALQCFDGVGRPVWKSRLPGLVCHAPMVRDLDRNGKPELLTISTQGYMCILDCASGSIVQQLKIPLETEVKGVTLLDLPAEEVALVLAEANRVHGVSVTTGALLWSTEVPRIRQLVTSTATNGLGCILALSEERRSGRGVMRCLDSGGTLRWQETRPLAPFTGNTLVDDVNGDRASECLYATRDHCLWCLSLP